MLCLANVCAQAVQIVTSEDNHKINVICGGANQVIDDADVEQALAKLQQLMHPNGEEPPETVAASPASVLLLQLEIDAAIMLTLLAKLGYTASSSDCASGSNAGVQCETGRSETAGVATPAELTLPVGFQHPVAFKPSPLDASKVDMACAILDTGVSRRKHTRARTHDSPLPSLR